MLDNEPKYNNVVTVLAAECWLTKVRTLGAFDGVRQVILKVEAAFPGGEIDRRALLTSMQKLGS